MAKATLSPVPPLTQAGFSADSFQRWLEVLRTAVLTIQSLQDLYGASSAPQVVTTTSGGPVQFKEGAATDLVDVVEVLNLAGAVVCRITGQGIVSRSGATATRPATPPDGLMFFDTTLKKPLWALASAGTGWVDATGAAV